MTGKQHRTSGYFSTGLIIGLRELRRLLQDLLHPLAGGRLLRYEFEDHPVIVWVPRKVHKTTPVLVMHDGHNLFDPKTSTFGATWGLLEALRGRKPGGARIRADKPVIIGVTYKDANGELRAWELGPTDIWTAHPELTRGMPGSLKTGPDGNYYHDLIANIILPAIAADLGLQLHPSRTATGGASMGALTSLYALAKYPDIYGTALAYSTHWPIGGEKAGRKLIDEYMKILPKPGTHRIWSDGGTLELDAMYWPLQEYFKKQMLKKGYREGIDYIEASYPNTGHSETWWRGRVEHPINWWLDPNEPKSTFENPDWVGKTY